MTSQETPAKRCCTCHELKPLTEYNKRAKARDGLQARCRECSRSWYEANRDEHKANTRRRARAMRLQNAERMRQYLLGHPCVDCGASDLRVLEFDHRPGVIKEAAVTRLVVDGFPWTRIMNEISKCDVRCANCHRIVTYQRSPNWRQKAMEAREIMPHMTEK